MFFFRKVDPKPLYQIVNKRLRKYVSEINELRFTIFHISGMKNYLSDCGSRFPSGVSGDDRGEALDSTKKLGSTVKAISASSDIREYMQANNCWLPSELPVDLPTDCPQVAQIFAYGATGPACDADCLVDDINESDDYVSQAMLEVASLLSISAGRQVSVAMTVDKLIAKIQTDSVYKYLRQTISGSIQLAKYVGELAVYNYH